MTRARAAGRISAAHSALVAFDRVVLASGATPRVPSRSTPASSERASSRSAELCEGLLAAGVHVELVGAADIASELDAERAIPQATEVAAGL